MQTSRLNLFTRDDTFFGVCEGLGQDFGFPPNLLRIVLAVTLIWNPLAAIGAYALGGVIVMLGRLLFPVPAQRAAVPAEAAPAAVEPAQLARAA